MENSKKWRPEPFTDADIESTWRKRQPTQWDSWTEDVYKNDRKTPSGLRYSYEAVMPRKYKGLSLTGRQPRYSAILRVGSAPATKYYGTPEELDDLMEMYENGNPFAGSEPIEKSTPKGPYEGYSYYPYKDTPEYNAWLKQFRDYAHDKWGITDEDETSAFGKFSPLSPDYMEPLPSSPGDDWYSERKISMPVRAVKYLEAMRKARDRKEASDLFGRDIKK